MAAGQVWIFDNWLQHHVENPVDSERIHLVVDTHGSAEFWSMVEHAMSAADSGQEMSFERIDYRPEHVAMIRTEQFNTPGVMSPGEMEWLVRDLLEDVRAAPVNSAAGRSAFHGCGQCLLPRLAHDLVAARIYRDGLAGLPGASRPACSMRSRRRRVRLCWRAIELTQRMFYWPGS